MKNIVTLFIFLFITLTTPFYANASELDSFTLRKEVLSKKDSLSVLNRIVRQRLKEGEKSLHKNKGCQKKTSLKRLKNN